MTSNTITEMNFNLSWSSQRFLHCPYDLYVRLQVCILLYVCSYCARNYRQQILKESRKLFPDSSLACFQIDMQIPKVNRPFTVSFLDQFLTKSHGIFENVTKCSSETCIVEKILSPATSNYNHRRPRRCLRFTYVTIIALRFEPLRE